MKKIISVLAILTIISCSLKPDQSITHNITVFDNEIIDTIIPIKGERYGSKFIYVKGYVDDSVYVSFGGRTYKHYLFKEIDTVFSMEFYGASKAVFVFHPYKATKGKLEVKFKI